MSGDPAKRQIVIIGGGIIGCSTAYYLTRHPAYNPDHHCITLLEASSIAGGASGKAGGLVALWAYPSCIVPLSFNLHAELAREHNGEELWGYRQVHSGQLNARGRAKNHSENADHAKNHNLSLQKLDHNVMKKLKTSNVPSDLDWFDADSVFNYQEMGDPSNTAQVHPFLFTTSMARFAEERGLKIKSNALVSRISQNQGRVQSVTFENRHTGQMEDLSATDVIIAAGPWSRRIYSKLPITAMRAHSVTIEPTRPVSAYVIFTEISSAEMSKQVSPEIYARPNNEVYACGEGDHLVALPDTTANVEVDDTYCSAIIDQVGSISDELKYGKVTAKQACYLPNVQSAVSGPLIGFTDVTGLLCATGHTCWGISNGPGTGKLVSEILFDGAAKSADVRNLDPRKLL